MVRFLFACLLVALPTATAFAEEAPVRTAAGEEAYQLCVPCHEQGQGNVQHSAPALAGLSEEYVGMQLANYRAGIRGAAKGDFLGAQMMTLAGTLEESAVADLAAYVATLEAKPVEATVEGDAERGATLYTLCATCHGPDGTGVAALGGNNLVVLQDWYLVRQLEGFKAGFRGKDPKDLKGMQMAGMVATLPDAAAIRDVVAYIASLRPER